MQIRREKKERRQRKESRRQCEGVLLGSGVYVCVLIERGNKEYAGLCSTGIDLTGLAGWMDDDRWDWLISNLSDMHPRQCRC
jgi:hypothetical protein